MPHAFAGDPFEALAFITYKSRLNAMFKYSSLNCIQYLRAKYGFSRLQSVVVAIILNTYKPLTLDFIADFLGLPTDQAGNCKAAINELVACGVLVVSETNGEGLAYDLNEELKSSFMAFDELQAALHPKAV